MGFVRDSFGIHSGFIWDPFGIHSGFIRDPFGIRLGFIRDSFGIRSGFIRDSFGIPSPCRGSPRLQPSSLSCCPCLPSAVPAPLQGWHGSPGSCPSHPATTQVAQRPSGPASLSIQRRDKVTASFPGAAARGSLLSRLFLQDEPFSPGLRAHLHLSSRIQMQSSSLLVLLLSPGRFWPGCPSALPANGKAVRDILSELAVPGQGTFSS